MGTRILIVDDNSVIRKLLRRCLESVVDWQICGEAGNGKEAIEKAQQLHPNFIVLDLSMPVMNGLEAAKILHQLMPAVPLVMFTSFITPRLKQEALSAGIRQVIAKDDSTAGLINAVRLLTAKEAA